MTRVSSELKLHERSARLRLSPRRNPYWRLVCGGQHLGYYRGARLGTWIARYRAPGDPGNGSKLALGIADDIGEANGETVLSWRQALDKARAWFELQEKGGVDVVLNPNITVADAIEAYIEMRNARRNNQRGRTTRSDAANSLTRNVLEDGRFAKLALGRLPKPT